MLFANGLTGLQTLAKPLFENADCSFDSAGVSRKRCDLNHARDPAVPESWAQEAVYFGAFQQFSDNGQEKYGDILPLPGVTNLLLSFFRHLSHESFYCAALPGRHHVGT